MIWAYGLTTVPSRKDSLFPRTLNSLRKAGFENPRIFLDGTVQRHGQVIDVETIGRYKSLGLEVTVREQNIRTFGNWYLGLWELYLRQPHAKRYAIFQDDFVTGKNLRAYLESCPFPKNGYWNLYTFPQNQQIADKEQKTGWFESNQKGKGAVALVFDNEGVRNLLTSRHMVDRVQNTQRGHKAVDGGVVTAFLKWGGKEYCHNPSLVQHTGLYSSMGNNRHPLATSFRGEDFDCLELLEAGAVG